MNFNMVNVVLLLNTSHCSLECVGWYERLTLILIFNDICCPSITGTTDTGGVMRGTER